MLHTVLGTKEESSLVHVLKTFTFEIYVQWNDFNTNNLKDKFEKMRKKRLSKYGSI